MTNGRTSASQGQAPSDRSWFERHPGLTISGLICFLLLVGIIGTEFILARRAGATGLQRCIQLREHRPFFSHVLYPTPEDLQHAEILEVTKYRLRIDANGFIMPSGQYSDPDLSVIFLGGSTTECMYMDEDVRFPCQAGRLMEQHYGLRVNAANAGKAGNNSLHSINILINKILPLRPDIVVMMHNINDLIILLFEKSYWNSNPRKAPLVAVESSLRNSLDEASAVVRDAVIPNLYRAVSDISQRVLGRQRPTEFRGIEGHKITFQRSSLLQDFQANLLTFIEICRNWEIVPVLMTQANRFTEPPDPFVARLMGRLEREHGITYGEFKELFDLLNEQIRLTGRQHQVLVIDLARAVPQGKDYLYDTVHLTAAGSRLASQVICRDLEPVLASLEIRRRARPGQGQPPS